MYYIQGNVRVTHLNNKHNISSPLKFNFKLDKKLVSLDYFYANGLLI